MSIVMYHPLNSGGGNNYVSMMKQHSLQQRMFLFIQNKFRPIMQCYSHTSTNQIKVLLISPSIKHHMYVIPMNCLIRYIYFYLANCTNNNINVTF